MEFQFLVICATFRAVWTTLATVFYKIMSLFIISMFEIATTPILRQFYVTEMFDHLCHFSAIWTNLVTEFSKIMFIFVISMFEIVSTPILSRFYAASIFGDLCHFMCHLDQFGDSIFKNHVHFRNQHV